MDARYCSSAGMRGVGDLIRIGHCLNFSRIGGCGNEPVASNELQHPVFEASPLEGGHHLLAMRLSFPRAHERLHSRSRFGLPLRLGPLWAASAAARHNERQENADGSDHDPLPHHVASTNSKTWAAASSGLSSHTSCPPESSTCRACGLRASQKRWSSTLDCPSVAVTTTRGASNGTGSRANLPSNSGMTSTCSGLAGGSPATPRISFRVSSSGGAGTSSRKTPATRLGDWG